LLEFLLLFWREQRHHFRIRPRPNDCQFCVDRSEFGTLLPDRPFVDRTGGDRIFELDLRRAVLFPKRSSFDFITIENCSHVFSLHVGQVSKAKSEQAWSERTIRPAKSSIASPWRPLLGLHNDDGRCQKDDHETCDHGRDPSDRGLSFVHVELLY
jgi:hypothetical protein